MIDMRQYMAPLEADDFEPLFLPTGKYPIDQIVMPIPGGDGTDRLLEVAPIPDNTTVGLVQLYCALAGSPEPDQVAELRALLAELDLRIFLPGLAYSDVQKRVFYRYMVVGPTSGPDPDLVISACNLAGYYIQRVEPGITAFLSGTPLLECVAMVEKILEDGG